MILNALCEYYQRKQKSGELAPEGFEARNIPFVIVINDQGKFIQILSTKISDEEKVAGKRNPLFTIPKGHDSRTGKASYKKPNPLWDNPGFVLGHYEDDEKLSDKKRDDLKTKADNQHIHFIRLVDDIAAYTQDPEILAVQKFLHSESEKSLVKAAPEWSAVEKSTSKLLTFKVLGSDHLVCECKGAQSWAKKATGDASEVYHGQCLVTGKRTDITALHPPIKGVIGGNAAGARITSFTAMPTQSYRLERGENAAVSVEAAMQYGEALNHLLRQGSPNKFQMEKMNMVCWAEKGSSLETVIPKNFIFSPKDDPDAGVGQVVSAVNVLHSNGAHSPEGRQRFYLLGLKGVNGRLAVQYWKQATVYEIGESLKAWFDDIRMPSTKFGTYIPSIYDLLAGMSFQQDVKHISPTILPALVRAIFDNRRLPQIVLSATLSRIKAERKITMTRAALVKAFLNREARFLNQPQLEIGMSFEIGGKPIGYKLGALMAVYEKIQEDSASYKVGSSVVDKFYSSFSARPSAVLGKLDRLSKKHLAKLKRDKPSFYGNMTKRLNLLMQHIDCERIPASLSSKNQSYFAIGYYQQREDFFKKKTTPVTLEGDVA